MRNTFEMAKMNIRVHGKNFEDMDANEQLGVFSVGAERAEGELARRAKYCKLSRGSSPSFKFRISISLCRTNFRRSPDITPEFGSILYLPIMTVSIAMVR